MAEMIRTTLIMYMLMIHSAITDPQVNILLSFKDTQTLNVT